MGHCLVIGKTRQGKSYFMKNYLLENRWRNYKTTIIFNVERQIWEGIPCSTIDNVLYFIKLARNKNENVVINFMPEILSEDYEIALFEQLCKIAMMLRDCLIINDEVQNIMDEKSIGDWMFRLVRQGNKRNSHLLLGTQRPICINKIITTQFDEFYIFYIEDSDWESIKKWIGDYFYNHRHNLHENQYKFLSKVSGQYNINNKINGGKDL